MRIAILTLPLQINYGGIVQNYALQTVLRGMGHEVETINLKRALLWKKYDISFLKRIVKPGTPKAKRHIRQFIDQHIRLTAPFYNKRDFLKHDFSAFGAIIVGSDQVWRACYAYPDLYTYYLDFVDSRTAGKGIRKIAFSASLGTDAAEYTPEQIQKCGAYIRQFDRVSVRENSALTLMNDVYKWTCKTAPVQTLDPTMLLCKDDYIGISASYGREETQGGLFYYILDMTEEKRSLIRKISSDLGVKPFTVKRKSRRWYDKPEDRMVPPVEEWLQAFHNARYIFTDSFHGSVFSIIFNKEFIAFGNKKRGMDRFHSLLDTFNLAGRLIGSASEYRADLYENAIDWTSVNGILDGERQRAVDFLVCSLSVYA